MAERCFLKYQSYTSYSSNRWFLKSPILGTGWDNHYIRADVAIRAITAFVLIGIAIWALLGALRRRGAIAPKLFPFYAISISCTIWYYIWSFINEVLTEECAVVEQVYYIFNSIFLSVGQVADIVILATAFTFLMNRTQLVQQLTRRKVGVIIHLHLVFCGLLMLFWLVMLALDITQEAEIVDDYNDSIGGIFKAFTRMEVAYDTLYLAAALEVVAWTGWLLTVSKGRNSGKMIPLLFFALVALPLLWRDVWSMIFDIRYDLLEIGRYGEDGSQDRLVFTYRFFEHICTLAIYGGLAAIFVQLRKEALTNEMVEQGQPGVMRLAEPQPVWNQHQQSRDHSQDPIFDGK